MPAYSIWLETNWKQLTKGTLALINVRFPSFVRCTACCAKVANLSNWVRLKLTEHAGAFIFFFYWNHIHIQSVSAADSSACSLHQISAQTQRGFISSYSPGIKMEDLTGVKVSLHFSGAEGSLSLSLTFCLSCIRTSWLTWLVFLLCCLLHKAGRVGCCQTDMRSWLCLSCKERVKDFDLMSFVH